MFYQTHDYRALRMGVAEALILSLTYTIQTEETIQSQIIQKKQEAKEGKLYYPLYAGRGLNRCDEYKC